MFSIVIWSLLWATVVAPLVFRYVLNRPGIRENRRLKIFSQVFCGVLLDLLRMCKLGLLWGVKPVKNLFQDDTPWISGVGVLFVRCYLFRSLSLRYVKAEGLEDQPPQMSFFLSGSPKRYSGKKEATWLPAAVMAFKHGGSLFIFVCLFLLGCPLVCVCVCVCVCVWGWVCVCVCLCVCVSVCVCVFS